MKFDFIYILYLSLIFLISFTLVFTLLMLNSDTYYRYTYVDVNYNLGHSSICKNNYCDVDNKKVFVLEYIDNRK